jgi:hypothetical protein
MFHLSDDPSSWMKIPDPANHNRSKRLHSFCPWRFPIPVNRLFLNLFANQDGILHSMEVLADP